MSKIVVIGAGFAGHTAALYLGSKLGKKHEVTVISNRDVFGYVPSWVWVGVGHMKPEDTVFKLAPVYKKKNVRFVHAAAKEIHPEPGDQYVLGEEIGTGKEVRLDYDYLVKLPPARCSTLRVRPVWDLMAAIPIPFALCRMRSKPATPTWRWWSA